MKTNKYVEDLRTKSATDLNDELVAAKKELFNLRFQNATNQLENTSRINDVRKNIARIQTVITEMKKASK
ncbi:MAG: 50S ribosomal protein L29 [Herbinix sp.]|nr:50S ribosomal protein L29 [Herbinix sp.]